MDVNHVNVEQRFHGTTSINGIILGLLGVLIISIVVLSCVPPVSRDALVHHLAVPKLYLKHGGMYEIPSMPFSYYPMNLDLLYLIPLSFGQDILSKFIHFSFALLTAGVIFCYLKPKTSITYGLLGVMFFLSTPIVIKLSITAYVDLGVIFFSTASIFLLFKWMKNGFSPGWLILSALFCGLAMGTKYNGLVIFFILTFAVPFLYSRYGKGGMSGFFRSTGYGTLFFLVAITVFSPWMIRNHQWKGNPIYPLYQGWLKSQDDIPKQIDVSKTPIRKSNRGLFTYRAVIYEEKWWEIALLPVRIFFQGEDGNPQYFDGKLNPFLFFLPIFAFYRMREGPGQLRREKIMLLVFALLFLLIVVFTRDLRLRYVSPIIPALVVLSVFGLENIREMILKLNMKSVNRFGLIVVGMLVIIPLGINTSYLLEQFRIVEPFSYIRGDLTRDDYIAKHRSEYPALQYVNERLPSEALILFVFAGKRGYYCDRNYVISGEFWLRRFIHRAKSPEEIMAELKRKGYTHLFIYNPIFVKWADDMFEIEKKRILEDFFSKYVKTLYHKNGFSVSVIEYPLA